MSENGRAPPTRPTKARFPTARPILAENANRSWIIGVADPSWPFRDRQSVTLVLTYDGQAQFEVSGSAAREKVVIGDLPSQAAMHCANRTNSLSLRATGRCSST
jgi:hypothetical protein